MGCREGETEREAKRGEEKKRDEWGRGEEEEGDKRESLTWRQTAFQYPPANYTDTCTKYRRYASGTEVLLVASHCLKLD